MTKRNLGHGTRTTLKSFSRDPNGDGRPDVEDQSWQAFASRNDLAIFGCRFTDKPHDEPLIENYANAAKGGGQALWMLLWLSPSVQPSGISGCTTLLWGMSAGGQFNYEFTAWKPERVVAFVVNKGGIYFSALFPRPRVASRDSYLSQNKTWRRASS